MNLNNQITILDDLVSTQKIDEIFNYCKIQSFKRTEIDYPGLPYTGLVSELDLQNFIVNYLVEICNLSKKKLLRAYINLFIHNEKPFYHQDDVEPGAKTLIYYANPQPKDYNDLGETFFIINNEVKGITPKPGRIIIFDAELWHKATPLRIDDRYTVALKWTR